MKKVGTGGKIRRTPEASYYDVGYRKPPREHQFKKGRSGNPKGRKRGALSLSALMAKELFALITISENGRVKKITKVEAALKQLVNKAAQGDRHMLKLMLAHSEVFHNQEEEGPGTSESFKKFVALLNDIAGQKASKERDN